LIPKAGYPRIGYPALAKVLLFQDRFLFVKRRLTPWERKRLRHITRGLPQLRKLRDIMEHIYALFDRRCHTQTALGKLRKLRQWVQRFTWIGET
jgi:hypothetical protein